MGDPRGSSSVEGAMRRKGISSAMVCTIEGLVSFLGSTHIVEDWKIGCRVKRTKVGTETLIVKEEISEIAQRFMDLSSSKGKQMRDRAKNLKDICHRATWPGGSSRHNLDGFIWSISKDDTK
ncbi:hypothetical protein Csa_023323 [Cucumis sativus]|uniref:Uncharacterized protein n=1 Tax=Cucumis sativus TaxID=3659 RepID=A0A0A0M0X4_CUCSA|nr:hypothetical protein Csa_023323 [Cucumis sativus]